MKTFTLYLKSLFCLALFVSFAGIAMSQTRHSVEVRNNFFSPDELKISVGDTVVWTNAEGYHNVNGTMATFPDNPESFGNSPGNGWTYTYVFKTPGQYDYQCDPHAGLGMNGKVEVENSNDELKQVLTLHFMSMNPHIGQRLHLNVTEKNSGKEIERKVEDIQSDFQVQVSGIEKDHSYYINFFADHNSNGLYDAPPTDHAWRMELNNVGGDTTLTFTHNTSFTNIMWKYNLTLNFSGMNPHDGQTLYLYLKESDSGSEVYSTQAMVSPSFSIQAPVLETGKSYFVDFYSDHNSNGTYDAPPADHAWRLQLNSVANDTVLSFVHNTSFTDIFDLTAASELNNFASRIYPNPVNSSLFIETRNTQANISVNLYNLAGKKLHAIASSQSASRMELNVNKLKPGIYLLEIEDGTTREMHKLIKQ